MVVSYSNKYLYNMKWTQNNTWDGRTEWIQTSSYTIKND